MSAVAATNSPAGSAAVNPQSDPPPPPPTRAVEVESAKRPSSATPSPAKGPVDIVDLSDHAKALLARAKLDQAAADRLTAQLEAAKGTGKKAASPPKSNDGSQLFDKLSGRAQSSASAQLNKSGSQAIGATQTNQGYVNSNSFELDDYVEGLRNANTLADGTIGNFHVVLKDVLTPSTPEQIDVEFKLQQAWVQANPEYIAWAKENDPDGYAYREAYANGAVTYLNAKDIPDLNFHNTVDIVNNSVGTSVNTTTVSYNHNASIFQDPDTYYTVSSNGDVIGWKRAPAASS